MKILTSTAMKAAEAAAVERGGSYLDLMENAGGAAAKRIAALLNGIAGKQALIFCGKGNNGGDGLVIARKFLEAGALVTVIFAQGCGDAGVDEQKLSPLSRANLRAMDGWGEDRLLILDCTLGDEQLAALVQQAAVIVDAVFGTGFSGILPAGTARLNRAAAKACGLLCAGGGRRQLSSRGDFCLCRLKTRPCAESLRAALRPGGIVRYRHRPQRYGRPA